MNLDVYSRKQEPADRNQKWHRECEFEYRFDNTDRN